MRRLAVAVFTSILLQAPSAGAQAPQPAAPAPAPAAPPALAMNRYADRSFRGDQREISRFTLPLPVTASR